MNPDFVPPIDVGTSLLAAWVGGLLMKDDVEAILTALWRRVRRRWDGPSTDEVARMIVDKAREVRHG